LAMICESFAAGAPLSRVPRMMPNKKAPRDGASASGVLSREGYAAIPAWEGSLAHSTSADYSGGTAADLHGTSPLPCPVEMSIQCTVRLEGCQWNQGYFPGRKISDSSNSVFVSPPARANLPENLPGDTVHSEKCPWTFSGRRATTSPCR